MNMNKNDKAFLAEQIRTQYIAKQPSGLDELQALDRKVHRPVQTRAYVFGSIAALIMGFGMSLIMTDFGSMIGLQETMVPGIIIGLIGMLFALINYPAYKKQLKKRKAKYADEILALSQKCLEE